MPKIYQLFPIVFLVLLFAGCGSDTVTGNYQNPLMGEWTETYRTYFPIQDYPDPWSGPNVPDPIQIYHPDYGTYVIDLPLRSVVRFTNYSFNIKIFDDRDILQKELRGIYDRSGNKVVLNVEYTWAGYYDAWQIEYDQFAEYSDSLIVDFFEGDSLGFSTISGIDESTGMITVPMSSIIWSVPGGLGVKASGIFTRTD